MTQSRLDVLVLDFDGVILESEGVKTETFREVASRFPDHVDAFMVYHRAHPTEPRAAKFQYFVAEMLGRPDDRTLIEELTAVFSARVQEQLADCPLVAGSLEFLEEFAPRLPLYLASITPEAALLAVVKQRNLHRFFAEIFGYPPRRKSHAVARALARVNGDRTRAALVGDSPSDLQLATEAGIEFIGRDSGVPFDDDGVTLHPDMYGVADVVRSRCLL